MVGGFPHGRGFSKVLLDLVSSPVYLVLTLTRILDSVPISKLPQLVYETQQDIERSGIMYSVVGHAGDGKYLEK